MPPVTAHPPSARFAAHLVCARVPLTPIPTSVSSRRAVQQSTSVPHEALPGGFRLICVCARGVSNAQLLAPGLHTHRQTCPSPQ